MLSEWWQRCIMAVSVDRASEPDETRRLLDETAAGKDTM
jgi:hypothetical protein